MWAGEHFSQLSTLTRRAIINCIVINTTVMVCFISPDHFRGIQRQFLENISSEDDFRSRIFGTFVFKFLACLPLLRFSNPPKTGIIAHF